MARVLFVSKPVCPPWNDSSKNLVRELARAMRRHEPVVMTPRGVPLAGVASEAVYRKPGSFVPGLWDHASVVRRLLLTADEVLWHFFFAPNPRTSGVAASLSALRRMPSVQTVCSAPPEGVPLERVLFARRIVVLSEHTERRLLSGGIAPERLERIGPAVSPLDPASYHDEDTRQRLGLPPDRRLVVYPGDLEFGGGAQRALDCFARLLREGHSLQLVMACRAKTSRARQAQAELQDMAEQLGIAGSLSWVGETAHIHALLACAQLVLLPATSLYAKMDLPLVLLEAMMLGRPVLVCQDTPAAELALDEGARAAPKEQLHAAANELLRDETARVALGHRAREVALAKYHPDIMARAYESLYDRLLDEVSR